MKTEPTQNITIKNIDAKQLKALRLRAVIEGYANRTEMLRAVMNELAEPYMDVSDDTLLELEKDEDDAGK